MKILKKLKISYLNLSGDNEEAVFNLTGQGLQEDQLPKNITHISVYYEVVEYIRKDNCIYKASSGPLGLMAFKFNKNKNALSQINMAALSLRLPKRIFIGKDVREAYYVDMYESCHPELDVVKEHRQIKSPDLKNIKVPEWCEKFKIYTKYYEEVIIEGSVISVATEPTEDKTFFIGKVINVDDNAITFSPRNKDSLLPNGQKVKRHAFATADDVVIDPRQIDETGGVHI